ncbi:hypothetical protein ACN9M0_35665 [Streptomyces sp. R-07]|uniref:hypothetical protein n=1 Tax=unclassified Streptomyces TaxID=2593676 RepID=UPI0034476A08
MLDSEFHSLGESVSAEVDEVVQGDLAAQQPDLDRASELSRLPVADGGVAGLDPAQPVLQPAVGRRLDDVEIVGHEAVAPSNA